MTTREMCRIECGHPGIFLVDVKSKSFPDVVKVVQKLESSRVQIEVGRCDTVLLKSAEIHDTCIRPRVHVCGSMFNDGRTRAHVTSAMLQQNSSQRVGALSPIPSCLGIGGHLSGSRQGHPRYTGARSPGTPWVARTTVHHSKQCRYIPNFLHF